GWATCTGRRFHRARQCRSIHRASDGANTRERADWRSLLGPGALWLEQIAELHEALRFDMWPMTSPHRASNAFVGRDSGACRVSSSVCRSVRSVISDCDIVDSTSYLPITAR